MGDGDHSSLPPGCRFYPSEEVLLRYYLTNKNQNRDGNFYGSDLIRELNLYDHHPLELPHASCFSYGYRGRKRHWFCYTLRVTKESSRKVKNGFWLRKGRVRRVFANGGNDDVLGTRTCFVFYIGNSLKNATRTDWILYEYALVDRVLASFVLCRVFNKPNQKNNSPSEIGLSCCAEESVSAVVRHVGVQVCDDGFVERKNEMAEHRVIECAGVQGSDQERLSGLQSGRALFMEAVTSQQHIRSILDDDFIELNDIA